MVNPKSVRQVGFLVFLDSQHSVLEVAEAASHLLTVTLLVKKLAPALIQVP